MGVIFLIDVELFQSLRAFRWPDPFGSGRLPVEHHCVVCPHRVLCGFAAIKQVVSLFGGSEHKVVEQNKV